MSDKYLLENTDIPYTECQRFVRAYGHTYNSVANICKRIRTYRTLSVKDLLENTDIRTLSGKDKLETTDIPYTEW